MNVRSPAAETTHSSGHEALSRRQGGVLWRGTPGRRESSRNTARKQILTLVHPISSKSRHLFTASVHPHLRSQASEQITSLLCNKSPQNLGGFARLADLRVGNVCRGRGGGLCSAGGGGGAPGQRTSPESWAGLQCQDCYSAASSVLF